jgi:AraC family transcriptional regulator of arabinose operon
MEGTKMKVLKMKVNMTLPKSFRWEFVAGCDNYLFVMFKSPSVVVLNGVEVLVDTGDTVLFNKFDPQIYFPREGEFVHDFIHIDYEDEFEKNELADFPFSSVIYANNHNEMSGILSIIQRHRLSNSPFDKQVVKRAVQLFLLMLKNNAQIKKNKVHERLFDLRSEIYNFPQYQWTVEYMAKKLAICPSALQTIYKQTFGISCIADVIRSRIEEAKRLLCGSEMPVYQISELCGYQNSEHFIRQFKKEVGVTPLVFRKEGKNQ